MSSPSKPAAPTRFEGDVDVRQAESQSPTTALDQLRAGRRQQIDVARTLTADPNARRQHLFEQLDANNDGIAQGRALANKMADAAKIAGGTVALSEAEQQMLGLKVAPNVGVAELDEMISGRLSDFRQGQADDLISPVAETTARDLQLSAQAIGIRRAGERTWVTLRSAQIQRQVVDGMIGQGNLTGALAHMDTAPRWVRGEFAQGFSQLVQQTVAETPNDDAILQVADLCVNPYVQAQPDLMKMSEGARVAAPKIREKKVWNEKVNLHAQRRQVLAQEHYRAGRSLVREREAVLLTGRTPRAMSTRVEYGDREEDHAMFGVGSILGSAHLDKYFTPDLSKAYQTDVELIMFQAIKDDPQARAAIVEEMANRSEADRTGFTLVDYERQYGGKAEGLVERRKVVEEMMLRMADGYALRVIELATYLPSGAGSTQREDSNNQAARAFGVLFGENGIDSPVGQYQADALQEINALAARLSANPALKGQADRLVDFLDGEMGASDGILPVARRAAAEVKQKSAARLKEEERILQLLGKEVPELQLETAGLQRYILTEVELARQEAEQRAFIQRGDYSRADPNLNQKLFDLDRKAVTLTVNALAKQKIEQQLQRLRVIYDRRLKEGTTDALTEIRRIIPDLAKAQAAASVLTGVERAIQRVNDAVVRINPGTSNDRRFLADSFEPPVLSEKNGWISDDQLRGLTENNIRNFNGPSSFMGRLITEMDDLQQQAQTAITEKGIDRAALAKRLEAAKEQFQRLRGLAENNVKNNSRTIEQHLQKSMAAAVYASNKIGKDPDVSSLTTSFKIGK